MALRLGRSRLLEHLVARGKSQVDLALFLKVSEPYISLVANNKANLSVLNMKRTVRFLGLRCMDDLIDWDERLLK